MNQCVFGDCNQGRKECIHSECGYLPLIVPSGVSASDRDICPCPYSPSRDESPAFDIFALVLYVITAGLALAFSIIGIAVVVGI